MMACASDAGRETATRFFAAGRRVPARFAGVRLVPPRAVVFFAMLFLAGIGYLPPAFGAGAFLSAGFAPVCPRNRRVGANSPSLCPTMFSVT